MSDRSSIDSDDVSFMAIVLLAVIVIATIGIVAYACRVDVGTVVDKVRKDSRTTWRMSTRGGMVGVPTGDTYWLSVEHDGKISEVEVGHNEWDDVTIGQKWERKK